MTTRHVKPVMPLVDDDFPMLTCGLIDAEVKRRSNAYPQLVAALRALTAFRHTSEASRARALLRSLGELE